MTSDIFDDLFGDFERMNRRFDDMFADLMNKEGVTAYGYRMYQGPDGIPHVYEYGNTGQNVLTGTCEPLTDVSVDGDKIRVTIEIPGVNKEDIDLEGGKNSITVSVSGKKNFKKTVALPNEVDMDTATASYNNGLLEVIVNSLDTKPEGKKISIE